MGIFTLHYNTNVTPTVNGAAVIPVLNGVPTDASGNYFGQVGDAAGFTSLTDLAAFLNTSPTFANPTFTGRLTSTNAVATPSALLATTFTAFASTVSGAVVMGFGTTNDVTLMNQAGAVVLGVTANTTTLTMTGRLASLTALATPSAFAATAMTTFASTVSGAALMGFGTGSDVALLNRAGTSAFYVYPNTTSVVVVGDLGWANLGGNNTPMLRRSTTILQCLLGDGSAGAPFTAASLIATVATGSGVGYGTGVGGTVTQGSGSGKATGFTLSKLTGQITTDNAALNLLTIVSATWTNTTIAATDTVIINHVSGGTLGAYMFNVACGAGTATLTIRNATAGSLSEALVLAFTVVKGAAS